jgi:hypothetical protein
VSILAKPKPNPSDDIADARAKLHAIETQRGQLWAAFQRHLSRADELKAARADLLLHGDTVSLIRNSEATEAALLLGQTSYADYAALAQPQLAAESAVRGAIGRRAPDRARDIADEYAARVERVRDHAEAARDHAEALVALESESETLYKTHGATIPSLPLAGGAVSLRSTIEVHLIEPLQRYADAVARNRADADLAAAANKKWQADRKRAKEQWQGDPDAFNVESPSFPDGTVSFTKVHDEHGTRRLYSEDKQDKE